LSARIVVIAIDWGVGASYSRVATGEVALIDSSASDGGEEAASDWIAVVGSASISVIAFGWSIDAAISSDVGSAALGCALVSVIAA